MNVVPSRFVSRCGPAACAGRGNGNAALEVRHVRAVALLVFVAAAGFGHAPRAQEAGAGQAPVGGQQEAPAGQQEAPPGQQEAPLGQQEPPGTRPRVDPGRQNTRAEQAPQETVRRLHDALVEAASRAGEAAVDERYRLLEPIVLATHDLPYIAELSIRRQWRDLGDDERMRFVAAFERLSITTYASRFRNLRPGMFSIDGSEPIGDERWRVLATLTTADGDTIPFEYVLHDTGEGWKIVNILADNVSDLALKRSEYRRLLEDGSIEDLIAELDRQTREVAE